MTKLKPSLRIKSSLSMDDMILEVLLNVERDTFQNGIVAAAKFIKLAQYNLLIFTVPFVNFRSNFSTNIGPNRLQRQFPLFRRSLINRIDFLVFGEGF